MNDDSKNSARCNSKINFFVCLLLILIAEFFIFGSCANSRILDRDEGYYLYASKLVMQGKIPYLDFFYPQMPYLPYFYGAWMRIFGYTWESGRALSALFASLTGLLLYTYVRENIGRLYAIAGILAYVLCGWVFVWFVVAKTYAASVFFLLLSFYLCSSVKSGTRKLPYIVAGLCAAITCGFRLYFIVCIPLHALTILQRDKHWRKQTSLVLYFILGIILGISPILILAIQNSELFYYNNIGYHLNRALRYGAEDDDDKRYIVGSVFNFYKNPQIVGAQLSILSCFAVLPLLGCVFNRTLPHTTLLLAFALFFASVAPHPIYPQYFSILPPFLIISALCGFKQLGSIDTQTRWSLALSSIFLIATALLYCKPILLEFERYTKTGQGVTGITSPKDAASWQIANLRNISTAINTNTKPGEVILSTWPGHLLETHVLPYPGTENHFGARASMRLSPEEQDRFHVLSIARMQELIKWHSISLVVSDNTRASSLGLTKEEMQTFGYTLVDSFGTISVWKLNATQL